MDSQCTILYPVSFAQLPVVTLTKRYRSQPGQDYLPVATNSCYHAGKDISILDNRSAVGVSLQSLGSGLPENASFIITSGFAAEQSSKQLAIGIGFAKTNNCNLVRTLEKDSNMDFTSIPFIGKQTEEGLNLNLVYGNRLVEPTIPIISVGSMIGFANQAEIAAKIALELRERGIKASAAIASSDYCLLNCFRLPAALMNDELSLEKRIVRTNHYINYLVEANGLEMLVVEMPGGLAKYNSTIFNDFGQYAYIFSQAVQVDYFVCCSNINVDSVEYFNLAYKLLYDKYDWETLCMHISNCYLDYEELSLNHPNKIAFLPMSLADRQISKLQREGNVNPAYRLLNLLSEEHFQSFIHYLIEKLGG